MTRILYWNVQSFGSNSLFPGMAGKRGRRGDDDPDYSEPDNVTNANERLALLQDVARAVEPDIFVIVEVGPGGAADTIREGQLVIDRAAYELLRSLRRAVNARFRLVPPLVSGRGRRAEAVAVYYRDDRLNFVGPWGWSGAEASPVADLAELGQYPPPWGGRGLSALPPRPVPAGLPNAGCAENRLAGQWRFTNALGLRARFPRYGYRRPWHTLFADPQHPGGTRLIRLLAYHAPPNQVPPVRLVTVKPDLADAYNGTARLADVLEMFGPIPDNEVRCIVGDFNVSAFDTTHDELSYGRLRDGGYTQQLAPVGIPYEWPGLAYYVTHIRLLNPQNPPAGAHPWIDVEPEHKIRGYPGFGYTSYKGAGFGWYDAIDNVFTRYGKTAGGPATGMTVVNPVVGSPYTRDPDPPPGVPAGTVRMESRLDYPGVFGYDPAKGKKGISEYDDPAADNAFDTFKEWRNYGRVRSLSDHLPLAIDV